MNNSFNNPELSSTPIKSPNEYERRKFNPDEHFNTDVCSSIESTQYQTTYVSAMRNNTTESVIFSVNIGTNQQSREIKKLNSILEDEPVMTFISSS